MQVKSKLTATVIMNVIRVCCFASAKQIWLFQTRQCSRPSTMYRMKTVLKKYKYLPAGFFGDTEPR